MSARGSSAVAKWLGAAAMAAMTGFGTAMAQPPTDDDRKAPPDAEAADPTKVKADPSDPQKPVDVSRRRPGRKESTPEPIVLNPGAIEPASAKALAACEIGEGAYRDALAPCAPPVADRWRLAESLKLVKTKAWDPYHQNTLKGDRPILGTHDVFVVLTGISDTVVEPRFFPVPVGNQTTDRPGSNDLFGQGDSFLFSQTAILSAAVIQGSTAFKPPDREFRIALAYNYNYVEVEERRILRVAPSADTTRNDNFIGVQELFYDRHLRDVSKRYDFDSLRIGIQPFSADFRGFLFQDNQLGVRLFGNRDNNRFQYNVAAFARLEKDTNSGLNDVTVPIRQDYVFLANVFRQDFPVPGMTSLVTVAHNANREKGEITVDKNGFPARPALIGDLRTREYDVTYLGYTLDGRVGRLNLSASAYYAFGENRANSFTGRDADISAAFVAAEPSIDFDWIRLRGSFLYASGDDDPYDDRETGFDAIFENPQFAGADTSYWIRQSVPFIGGGRAISLSGRNGVLNSLRSSKEQGQSNFANPGTVLLGAGADLDLTPEFRLSVNANHLAFAATETLESLRMEAGIGEEIGWDVSAAATYRPGFIQNFVFRLSAAALRPSEDFRDIYADEKRKDAYYSVLFNVVLTY